MSTNNLKVSTLLFMSNVALKWLKLSAHSVESTPCTTPGLYKVNHALWKPYFLTYFNSCFCLQFKFLIAIKELSLCHKLKFCNQMT